MLLLLKHCSVRAFLRGFADANRGAMLAAFAFGHSADDGENAGAHVR